MVVLSGAPMAGNGAIYAQEAASVTAQPPAGDKLVGRYFIDPASDPQLDGGRMTSLIREKIKYVFVIYNENQSFDHEYGTFPGANGIYADARGPRRATDTPGYTQTYRDSYSGETLMVRPFLLGPAQNGTVIDSVDHSHTGLAAKLRVVDGKPTMAGFAQDEFGGKAKSQANEARGRQFANIVMSHIDCDTIPFFWLYASRFTLFDNIFATEDTPSTPNAIAMIAGQSGETQWVKHGTLGTIKALAGTINGIGYDGQTGATKGFPLLSDQQPYWGSQFDTTRTNREPTGPKESFAATNIASNATFASIPLTAAGIDIRALLGGDLDPATNQADIQKDIPVIAAHGAPAVAWRWYQNGYDHEPTDKTATASHENFVTHHEGPQYFGYIADNTKEKPNLEGEGDFFSDIAAGKLPAGGGIIYIRGGFANIQGLKPPIQNNAYPRPLTPDDIATIQTVKAGDDDHPAYADRQISEAMNARVINAIASRPALWARSAIIITYDESDGFYDHVPPRILSYGPDGLPLARGIRVPLLLISPYARAHVVSHAEGDHNAIIETINQIFDLPALSSLPEESAAIAAGDAPAFNRFGPPGFEQKYLGPRDTNSAVTDSLISAFDPLRLLGRADPLPGSYAMIPNEVVTRLPHYDGHGCAAIGIETEDRRQGLTNTIPNGFNPLAALLPQYNAPAP